MKIGQLCQVEMPYSRHYNDTGPTDTFLANCRVVSFDAEMVCVLFESEPLIKDGLMKFFRRSEVREAGE